MKEDERESLVNNALYLPVIKCSQAQEKSEMQKSFISGLLVYYIFKSFRYMNIVYFYINDSTQLQRFQNCRVQANQIRLVA